MVSGDRWSVRPACAPSVRKTRSMKKLSALLRGAALVALVSIVAACDDNSFQVIEELEFAPSLGIDLGAMTMLASGVYFEDVVVGDGDVVLSTSVLQVTYEGYLANGLQFDAGQIDFQLGQDPRQLIVGFEQGVLGMAERGERRVIIPPELGYADQARGAIPAGSVLIFDIIVDSVVVAAPTSN